MWLIIKAASVLIGTVIGVGLFSVPFVASQSGLWLTIGYIVGLGLVVGLNHYFYAQVVSTDQHYKQRLVGFVREHLGRAWGWISSLTVLVTRLGALLIYIIVSGYFLSSLFGGSSTTWSLVFFTIGAILIWKGLASVAWVDVVLIVLMFVAMGAIVLEGFGSINPVNFYLPTEASFFLPYGVVLFALGGGTAIPEMAEIVRRRSRPLNVSMLLGIIVSMVVIIVFTILTVGVTGQNTTPEGLVGLNQVLGDGVMKFGLMFGVLALFTSFLTIGLNVKKTLWYDFSINKHLAWGLAVFIPLAVFLAGLTDFISIMGILGSVFGAINALFVVWLYRKLKPESNSYLPVVVALIFGFGIVYEILRQVGVLV